MKNKITNSKSLRNAIVALEAQREQEFYLMKAQFEHTSEELRPSKLIEGIFQDFRQRPVNKVGVFKTLFSIIGGYFTRRLLVGKSRSLPKTILAFIVQHIATNVIAKNVKKESA